MKTCVYTIVIGFFLLSLTACQPLTQIARVEGAASAPVEEFTTAAGERAMIVEAVQIEVGVGSPIPVDIFVSGTWPDSCAQLTAIEQRLTDFTIEVTILTTSADPNCPLDPVGPPPFRIAIPINVVQLPAGAYTVTVNGTSTNFTWPVAGSASADSQPPVENAILRYQGPAEMGSEDTSQCASLTVAANGQAGLQGCDGATQTVDLSRQFGDEWQEIQTRFAPFTYSTPSETLVFTGTGSIEGEAWQRALLAWARVKYGELQSGKVSAAVNTAASWHLGQLTNERNPCAHLTVLAYGYAYAEKIACEGLDLQDSVGGWLTNEEMERLDPWLYQRAAFYQDNNYIDGKGTQPLRAAEMAEAAQWAADLYARLSPGFLPSTTPTPPRPTVPAPTATATPATIGSLPTDVQYVMAS